MSVNEDPKSSNKTDSLYATQIIHTSKPLAPGEMLVGRFQIESLQGQGRYGLVYKALDLQLNTSIAIKVLNKSLSSDEQVIADFKSELLLVRQLSHPNIIRVHEYYQHEDLHFITMDWIEGDSLENIMAGEKISAGQTFDIIQQLLDGLAFAERSGVTHKDIKPENIMLDNTGRLFIADFGLSVFNKDMTSTVLAGTPYYAPPEYLQTGIINATTDLYAAGILIYQLCCHALPFQGNEIEEVLKQKLLIKPKFSAKDKGLNILKEWTLSLIAPHPTARPKNIEEAQQTYFNVLLDEPSKDKTIASRLTRVLLGVVIAVAITITIALTINGDKKIKSKATDHYSVAILPLEKNSLFNNNQYASFLTNEMSHISTLRVIDQNRIEDLYHMLGLKPPLSNKQLELLSDLLNVDVFIKIKPIQSGNNTFQVNFDLRTIEGFEVESEELISINFDTNNWAKSSKDFLSAVKERLQLKESSKAINKTPNNSPEILTIQSFILNGQYAEAHEAINVLIQKDDTLAQLWLLQGELYLKEGDYYQSEQSYIKTRELAKKNTYNYIFANARLNDLAEKIPEAEKDYQQLLSVFPYDPELKITVANFYNFIQQPAKAESILKDLVKIDPQHPEAWFLLGKTAYSMGNLDIALDEYFTKALVIAKKLNNTYLEAEALNAFGVVYEQQGETDLAFDYYRQSLEIRKKIGDIAGTTKTLLNIAQVHISIGEHDKAETNLLHCLDIYENVNSPEGISNIYNELGLLKEEQALYQDALTFFKDALTLRMDLPDLRLQAESMNNIGFASYMLSNSDNALVYWRQAEQIYQKAQFHIGIVRVRQNLGQLELAKGNWRNAYHIFNNSLKDAESVGSVEEIIVAKGYLAKLAFLQGNFTASQNELNLIFEQTFKLGDVRGINEFGLWLADWYLQIGDNTSAANKLAEIKPYVLQIQNKEYLSKFEYLTEVLTGNSAKSASDYLNASLIDRGHNSIYINQLLLSSKESLRNGNVDLSQQLSYLGSVDFSLFQYEYVEYLELLAIHQYYQKQYTDMAATLRKSELVLRKLGDYWRSFQFDRLRAQLALTNGESPGRYLIKVKQKLSQLLENIPAEQHEEFINKQNYLQFSDLFSDLAIEHSNEPKNDKTQDLLNRE